MTSGFPCVRQNEGTRQTQNRTIVILHSSTHICPIVWFLPGSMITSRRPGSMRNKRPEDMAPHPQRFSNSIPRSRASQLKTSHSLLGVYKRKPVPISTNAGVYTEALRGRDVKSQRTRFSKLHRNPWALSATYGHAQFTPQSYTTAHNVKSSVQQV